MDEEALKVKNSPERRMLAVLFRAARRRAKRLGLTLEEAVDQLTDAMNSAISKEKGGA